MAKPKDESEDLLELSKFRFTPERLRQACQRVQDVGGRYRWRDEACPHLTVRAGSRGGVFYRAAASESPASQASASVMSSVPIACPSRPLATGATNCDLTPEPGQRFPRGEGPVAPLPSPKSGTSTSTRSRPAGSRCRGNVAPSGRARSKLIRRTSRLTLKPTR